MITRRSMPKTILITGANRGIGRQLALSYAGPDVNLILIARDRQKLGQITRDCQELGANTISESIDVQQGAELKKFILDIDSKMPIDLVIANAGVSSTLQCNWQQEEENDVERVFAINLKGTLNTIQPLINKMIIRKKGQIVLMSSLAGLRGLPQSPSYCASKAALNVYGQSLRAWLARYGVNVNVVCPGYVKTDMSDALIGPKPFLISTKRAAKIIQKGLLKNRACIAFPWPLTILTRIASILPAGLVDLILNRFESYIMIEEQ